MHSGVTTANPFDQTVAVSEFRPSFCQLMVALTSFIFIREPWQICSFEKELYPSAPDFHVPAIHDPAIVSLWNRKALGSNMYLQKWSLMRVFLFSFFFLSRPSEGRLFTVGAMLARWVFSVLFNAPPFICFLRRRPPLEETSPRRAPAIKQPDGRVVRSFFFQLHSAFLFWIFGQDANVRRNLAEMRAGDRTASMLPEGVLDEVLC